MSLSTANLALEKLRAILLEKDAPRKTSQSTDHVLEKVCLLAANFACELTGSGRGAELERRANKFEAVMQPDGALDRVRRGAHAVASNASDLHLPGSYRSRGASQNERRPRRIVDLGEGRLMATYGFPSDDFPEIRDRLADLEMVKWQLQAALADADRLLGLELTKQQEAAFQNWRRELWRLYLSSAQEHLYGCFLLRECKRTLDPCQAEHEQHHVLLRRLKDNASDAIKALQDAAEYLLQLPEREEAKETPSHSAGFPYGPVVGKLKELASAICPVFSYEEDRRGLKRLHVKGEIRLEEVSAQSYKAFFKDLKTYAKANSKMPESREQQKRA